MMISRQISPSMTRVWKRGKSILLLGPRQTGKTTLASNMTFDLTINFLSNSIRQAYERNPDLIYKEVLALKKKSPALVFVDEVQKVPLIMDPIQDLIDKKKAQFLITGSSARKLKQQSDLNLLPGRVIAFKLSGLSLSELLASEHAESIPTDDLLDQILHYGTLPEHFLTEEAGLKEDLLKSYVEVYLEEEIRKEARLRSLAVFYRFLEHAAQQAGGICSYSGIAQDIGVSHVTVKSYYEILESTLIAERIEPLIQSRTRKKLIRSPRYLFFDLGVRRIAAREGAPLPRVTQGHCFEQFVGIEILKQFRNHKSLSSLHFWQDPEVADVDWVIKKQAHFLPIEVKMAQNITVADTKHLKTFMEEYPCPKGAIVICNTSRKVQVESAITAVPWRELPEILEDWL